MNMSSSDSISDNSAPTIQQKQLIRSPDNPKPIPRTFSLLIKTILTFHVSFFGAILVVIIGWLCISSRNCYNHSIFDGHSLNNHESSNSILKSSDSDIQENQQTTSHHSDSTHVTNKPIGLKQDCLVLNNTPLICTKDERIWSESLTHPSILWHYAPRRVLILGPLGGLLAAESLRHFTLTEITWVSDLQINDSGALSTNAKSVLNYIKPSKKKRTGYFKHVFQYDDVVDELNRVNINHGSLDAFFQNPPPDKKFDVILIDHVLASNSGPETITNSEKILVDGGILSIVDNLNSDAGVLNHLAAKFKNVHVGLEHIDSTNSNFLFMYASQSDLHLPLTSLSYAYVGALISRRIFDGDEDLDYYSGESHQRLFSIPRQTRKKLQQIMTKARINSQFDTTFAPHPKAKGMKPLNVKGVSIMREYYDCTDSSKMVGGDLLKEVKESLALSHSKIININVYRHLGDNQFKRNPTVVESSDSEDEDDREEEDDETMTNSSSLVITVIATLADGHFTLRSFPHKRYVSAEYTSFDTSNEVWPEEALGFMADSLGANRTVGVSVPRGQVMASTRSIIDHWDHGAHYWMSDKVRSKKSKTAGRGQFARVNIAKGEVLFNGPVEIYLMHEREIQTLPKWRKQYLNHMGEQAEDDIWISPNMYDEDESYFTNHNCNANLVYDGYDTMIARRDIQKGEELSFDYSTANAEPREIFKCNCGAPNCRGIVHGNDWMRQELVDNYGIKAFWPHIQKKIIRHRAGLPVLSLNPNWENE